MSEETVEIRPFDRVEAGVRDYQAFTACLNRLRAENWPDDPPISVDEAMRNGRSLPPFLDLHSWAGWRSDAPEIVATASASIHRTEDNRHLVFFGIGVVPEMRRQGLGTRLLRLIAEVTRVEGRRLLMTSTEESVPAAEAFMERLGARIGQRDHINQLDLRDLNRDLLREWQARAPERAAGFELGLWEGAYPEEALGEIAGMKQAINLAPRGELAMEDWHWTPERLRQEDESLRRRQVERWTMYVREAATGRIAGYTELFWNPERPETANQGDTAVFPDYQNRGLGRWLKAAMLVKLLGERPHVERVRTGNADSNAPMLRINTELGFKPYRAWCAWQVELDRVLDYLATRA